MLTSSDIVLNYLTLQEGYVGGWFLKSSSSPPRVNGDDHYDSCS